MTRIKSVSAMVSTVERIALFHAILYARVVMTLDRNTVSYASTTLRLMKTERASA